MADAYGDGYDPTQAQAEASAIDSSMPDPSSDFAPGIDAATSSTGVPAVLSASSTCPSGPATPSLADIKGLQNAANRFFGTAIGALIAVDGTLGPATLAAVNAIIAWMPSGNYDPTGIIALVGSSASVPSLTNYTVCISNLIDAIADDQGFTLGTSSPSSASFVQGSHGRVPTAPIPTGRSNQIANNLLGLNFPNWWLYVGGVAFLAGITWLIYDNKKRKGLSGLHGADDTDGADDDAYDEQADDVDYADNHDEEQE